MLAVHIESKTVSLRQVAAPVRPAGFALIRLLMAGICNTDLELQRGYYGFSGTPGHEFVGIVIAADTPELLGRRVVGEINLACGHCSFCAAGLKRHCKERTVLGIVKHPGAFAEFLTLPEENLRLVPDSVSEEQAVFVEPLAAACEILDQVAISEQQPIAVLGDGKLALLIAQVLVSHGARVTVFGRHAHKLEIAAEAGALTFVSPPPSEPAFSIVVEATGSAAGLRQAVAMVEPRGTVVMKSTVSGVVSIDMAPVIVNEITLVGSRCGRFEPAINLLGRKKIVVERMIAERFPLSRAPEAFAEAARRGVLKVLLYNDLTS